jgi:RNA polymerase sigma-70 factor (ECF subfamily)
MSIALEVERRAAPAWCGRYHPHVREPRIGNQLDALGLSFARGEVGLEDVYRAHGGLVYGFCRKTLGEASASDVTQDVFVSAWKGRDQFDPERGSLAAWLVGIAKRRIIDHVRRERRHSDRRADDIDDRAVTDGPQLDRIADRMVLARALSALAERPRRIITLAYVEGLTHQEIADRTGLPLGTIKSDIRRGLLTLRDHLESTHE